MPVHEIEMVSLTGKKALFPVDTDKTIREWMLEILPRFSEIFGNPVLCENTFRYIMINNKRRINLAKLKNTKVGRLIDVTQRIHLLYCFGLNAELQGNLDCTDCYVDTEQCNICFEKMDSNCGYETMISLGCKHAFHYKCIIKDAIHGRKYCSTCRTPHNVYINKEMMEKYKFT
jgi:hypothetical protein